MPEGLTWAVHFERWPIEVITGFPTREDAEAWIKANAPTAIDCRIMPTRVTEWIPLKLRPTHVTCT